MAKTKFAIPANIKIDELIKKLTDNHTNYYTPKVIVDSLEEIKKLNETDQTEAIEAIQQVAAQMGEDGQMRLSGTMAIVIQTLKVQLPPSLCEKVMSAVQKALKKMDAELTAGPQE